MSREKICLPKSWHLRQEGKKSGTIWAHVGYKPPASHFNGISLGWTPTCGHRNALFKPSMLCLQLYLAPLKPRRHLGTRDLYLYQMFIGAAPGNGPTWNQCAPCHPHLLGMHARPHRHTRNYLFKHRPGQISPAPTSLTTLHGAVIQMKRGERGIRPPLQSTPLRHAPFIENCSWGWGTIPKCQKPCEVHFPELQHHFLRPKSSSTIPAAKTLMPPDSWTFWTVPFALLCKSLPWGWVGFNDSILMDRMWKRWCYFMFKVWLLQLPFRFSLSYRLSFLGHWLWVNPPATLCAALQWGAKRGLQLTASKDRGPSVPTAYEKLRPANNHVNKFKSGSPPGWAFRWDHSSSHQL